MTYSETELGIVGVHALSAFLEGGVDALEEALSPLRPDDRVVALTGTLAALLGIVQSRIPEEDLIEVALAVKRRVGPLPTDDGPE